MRISLLTATGAYNLGDELILLQEYEYLSHRYHNATFTVFTYNQKSSLLPHDDRIRYVSYFPNNLRIHPFLNIYFLIQNLFHIARSDLLIIGWGGLIYDNETGQSFDKLLMEWRIRIFIAKLFHVPIFYWSLGIHVRAENSAKLLPLFQGNSIHISVRDIASKHTLDILGIKNTLISDPVFLYDPEIPKLLPRKRPKIGLSFRSWYLADEIDTIEQIITFLKNRDYDLILLNHSFHTADTRSNDAHFLRTLREKYHIVSTCDMTETLAAYKELEFVVGMRLHSLVLSVVHAIPFFAISYSKKTDELMRSLHYDFTLSAHTFSLEYFKARFITLEASKKEVQFALEAKNDTIKNAIRHTLKNIFHGLEKTTIRCEGLDW